MNIVLIAFCRGAACGDLTREVAASSAPTIRISISVILSRAKDPSGGAQAACASKSSLGSSHGSE
jgi:hypothetical protein